METGCRGGTEGKDQRRDRALMAGASERFDHLIMADYLYDNLLATSCKRSQKASNVIDAGSQPG